MCFGEGHFDQVLFTVSYAFFDGSDHVTGFTHTDPDLASFVANNHDRSKAELFTAFNNFSDAANLHNPLLPFRLFFGASFVASFFIALLFLFCHSSVLSLGTH